MLGEGFMVHKKLKNMVVNFDAINDRLGVVGLRGRN